MLLLQGQQPAQDLQAAVAVAPPNATCTPAPTRQCTRSWVSERSGQRSSFQERVNESPHKDRRTKVCVPMAEMAAWAVSALTSVQYPPSSSSIKPTLSSLTSSTST